VGRRGIFNGFFSHFRQRRFFGFWVFVIQVNESVATGNAGGSLANLLRIGQACPIILQMVFSELSDTLLEQVMTVLF
jgi:predicted PhzF superfamily epimerase YddE/YHI9